MARRPGKFPSWEEEAYANESIGKTAPCLIEDLRNYDPRTEHILGRNVLTSPPSTKDLYSDVRDIFPADNCRHNFVWKQDGNNQLPPQDSRPEFGSMYRVDAICQNCRHHLSLTISWTEYQASRTTAFASCPNQMCPLHHFQYIKEATEPRKHGVNEASDEVDRSYLFRCSSETCQAMLDISLRKPVFSDEKIELLTNHKRLQARYDTAKRLDPGRNDFQMVRPANALDALATYIKDGMDPSHTRRQVPVRNRRFMTTFGDDCVKMLETLGFTFHDETDEADGYCHLPTPPNQPDPEAFTDYLHDVREELVVLLHQLPFGERQNVRSIHANQKSMLEDVKRCLSCQGYKTVTRLRSQTVDLTQSDNAFAGLGALSDFSDDIVEFAFNRQKLCDPENTAHYIDCLGRVLEQRPQSESLQTALAILKSEGLHGSRDIEAAFAYFNLPKQQTHLYTEDHIIGVYNSRIADSGPSTHAEAREALSIIGLHLNSQKIRDIASTTLETFEQAIQYLELDANAQEDAITAMFGVKVADNQELAEKALQIVANHRNSTYLREILHQSQAGAPAMDLAEAFRIMGVEDRSSFDFDMLDVLLGSRIEEAPGRVAEFQKAAEVIRSSGDSSIVNNAMSNANLPQRPASEWPVGLENLGNTCYLNSLLQYYFTIKPFREILLNLDQYKEDPKRVAAGKKQVQGMKINVQQLERCQELAELLGDLFKDMISNPGHSVAPTTKLASAALIVGNRPFTLDQTDGAPVQGPSLPSMTGDALQIAASAATPVGKSSFGESAAGADSASDITLVGDDPTPPSSDEETMADEEWEQVEDVNKRTNLKDVSMPDAPTTEQSPTEPTQQITVKTSDIDDGPIKETSPTVPDRPPPVPPRNKSEGPQISAIEEAAKQQDVNEVIGNVLFQSEVAIKPDSSNHNAVEQDDMIKRTFFGRVKFNYESVDGQDRTEDSFEDRPEWTVSLAKKPADIMEAIDSYFDVEYVELNRRKIPRYLTIETLPPILQVFTPRVVYDREAGHGVKIETPMLIHERIFMDQFLGGDPKLIAKRRRRWKWKKELRVLQAWRARLKNTSIPDTTVADVLEGTSELLEKIAGDKTFHGDLMNEDLDADSELVEEMRGRADFSKQSLKEIEQRIAGLKLSIDDEFHGTEYQQHAYRLHAIFIHRGSAGFGHYWIYIRDFQRNKWLKYNDATVTEEENFDLAQVCKAEGSPAATPYFMVYVKEGREDELVESLHRQLPQLQQDIEMTDAAPQVIEGVEVQTS